MKFGSLCSGIEGASVAFNVLGWSTEFVAEVDIDACSVIRARHGNVRNLGDINVANIRKGSVDVIIAGTPCQSFSITGLRKGLNEDRGNIALQFFARVRDALPRWVIWENVPGVMSTNEGRDFGTILGAMAELGYGWAYRILDARYFGVAQRRKRVYVVGYFRDWRPAVASLFDWPTTQENQKQTEKVQKGNSGAVATPVLGWTGDETPKFGNECVPTLRAHQGGEGVGVLKGSMRKLSLTEWERLQGFPDGYTDVGLSDSVRRRLIGNSFCVPVIHWIGSRIERIERNA